MQDENTHLVQKCANQHLELKEVKDELVDTKNKFKKVQGILNEKNNELEKTKKSKEIFEKFVQSELTDAKNGQTLITSELEYTKKMLNETEQKLSESQKDSDGIRQ